MFYCYVLRSEKTGRRYVGSCENLADRIRRHNAGESKATKHGLPWPLIQSEAFATRTEAAQRERYYKLAGAEKSSTSYGRAVAAATGRGFKSHQPDSVDAASVAVLVSSTEVPKRKAFGTSASTL
jgi:putative endonuclease